MNKTGQFFNISYLTLRKFKISRQNRYDFIQIVSVLFVNLEPFQTDKLKPQQK